MTDYLFTVVLLVVFTAAFFSLVFTIEAILLFVGVAYRAHASGMARLERHDSRLWLAELDGAMPDARNRLALGYGKSRVPSP